MKNERSDAKVCARLRAARKIAGYRSSFDFSKKFNIPKSTYSQHESGSRIPKDVALEQYADYLGVNFNWLRYGRGLAFGLPDDERNKLLAKEIANKSECEVSKLILNEKLITMILTEVLDFAEKNEELMNNSQISKATITLYATLTKSTLTEPIHEDMVKIAVDTYFHFIKKNE